MNEILSRPVLVFEFIIAGLNYNLHNPHFIEMVPFLVVSSINNDLFNRDSIYYRHRLAGLSILHILCILHVSCQTVCSTYTYKDETMILWFGNL